MAKFANVVCERPLRVVSITSVSICQVSKHFFFVAQHVFQFVKNERLSSSLIRIFKEIFVKLVLLLKPSAVEYVVRENQNRTAKWVRHNRVKIFLRADLFRFSCTDVFTKYKFSYSNSSKTTGQKNPLKVTSDLQRVFQPGHS